MLLMLKIVDALCAEQDMLDAVSSDPNRVCLRFWRAEQGLVAPEKLRAREGSVSAEIGTAIQGWPVHYRCTGGDVTPQGPGIMNVSLAYALPLGMQGDVDASYQRLCEPIRLALGYPSAYGTVPNAFCNGAYNINIDGRKFAGTAQRFRRCKTDTRRFAVLSHAILLTTPLSQHVIRALNDYLAQLGREQTILVNAHTGLPAGLSQETFLNRLQQNYNNEFKSMNSTPIVA